MIIDRKYTISKFLRQPFMILWGICIHLIWGYGLIENSKVDNLSVLAGLNQFLDMGISTTALGIILMCAASLAAIGLALDTLKIISIKTGLTLLIPQYFFMIAAFLNDAHIIYTQHITGSNVTIDRMILICTIGPIMIAAFLHTLNILGRYVFVEDDEQIEVDKLSPTQREAYNNFRSALKEG